jgi:meiotically up-regulated gene 157 (Mug157) protein
MSLIMRAMTSNDEAEITRCVKWVVETDAETGFIHEAFLKNDPASYTRPWFAWANTLFGELIIKLYHERPLLLASI